MVGACLDYIEEYTKINTKCQDPVEKIAHKYVEAYNPSTLTPSHPTP